MKMGMKLLGLIGGMSWENTIEYYRILNEMVKNKLHGWNSAKILVYSLNFEEILSLQNQNKWDTIAEIMIEISKKLELAGSSAIILCSNTMHKIADKIQEEITIPLIHVVDVTAQAIKSKGINKVGLLGTKFTMEGTFYKEKMVKKYNIETIIPDQEERDYIHNVIYNELAQGLLLDSTKKRMLKIIENLILQGAQGIIFGCTEIPLLIKKEDVAIPVFDTLKIHLSAALDFALTN
ncbi:MAG: aspartate/glutamate racemase family protein [Candidatus Thorarchaeota archaeon]